MIDLNKKEKNKSFDNFLNNLEHVVSIVDSIIFILQLVAVIVGILIAKFYFHLF